MKEIKLISRFAGSFIFSLSLTHAQVNDTTRSKLVRLETAFKTIDNSYPKARYYDAGFSLVFGGLAASRGISILDDQATNSEKIIAYSLLGIGSVRIADALYSFCSSTSIEKDLTEFQGINDNQQKNEFGEIKLEQGAKRGKFMKYSRALLIGGTSASYLYLYNKGSKEYKILIYPGIVLAGITIYKLLSKSPEEKAWKHYKNSDKSTMGKKETGKINYYFSPYPKSFVAGVYLRF